jgi:FkbM family methyltransferase
MLTIWSKKTIHLSFIKMQKDQLLTALNRVEALAKTSRWGRLGAAPLQYIFAILYRETYYRWTRREVRIRRKTFYGSIMHLAVPSGMDIYLTGGKTHDSEIRLARFLIKNISEGSRFLDIGAHYGYFSLLVAKITGEQGRIVSIEASPANFKNLNQNINGQSNIGAFNLLASKANAEARFYEFPNLYSEYNSIDIDQFREQEWFHRNLPKEIMLPARRMDDFLNEINFQPQFIKIDVEGAESLVINGLSEYLTQYSPVIMMEVLSVTRGNESHLQAINTLYTLGYQTFSIGTDGERKPVRNVSEYLTVNQLDSDNIVIMRQSL